MIVDNAKSLAFGGSLSYGKVFVSAPQSKVNVRGRSSMEPCTDESLPTYCIGKVTVSIRVCLEDAL